MITLFGFRAGCSSKKDKEREEWMCRDYDGHRMVDGAADSNKCSSN